MPDKSVQPIKYCALNTQKITELDLTLVLAIFTFAKFPEEFRGWTHFWMWFAKINWVSGKNLFNFCRHWISTNLSSKFIPPSKQAQYVNLKWRFMNTQSKWNQNICFRRKWNRFLFIYPLPFCSLYFFANIFSVYFAIFSFVNRKISRFLCQSLREFMVTFGKSSFAIIQF